MHRLFLVSTLLINALIILIPACLTILLAFYSWDGMSAPRFVGLGNFVTLWNDRIFWRAFQNNMIWMAIFLTIPIAMGLLAATMLLVARRGRAFFKSSTSCRWSSRQSSPPGFGRR